MKYISIDIETTGLDKDKHQIVEIGAVIDELGSDTPIEDLPRFRAVLIHENMTINSFCANLHRDLWPEILAAQRCVGPKNNNNNNNNTLKGVYVPKADRIDQDSSIRINVKYKPITYVVVDKYYDEAKYTHYMSPAQFEVEFHTWLRDVLPGSSEGWYTHGGGRYKNPNPIKINVAGKNPAGFDIPFIEALPNWQGLIKFCRRVFDPASHYVRDTDECLPDLQECINRAGFAKTVSHTAVDDAMDVVRLIRHVRKSTFIHIQGDVVADPDKQIAIYQPYCLRCSKRNMCEVCADDSHEVTDCTDRHISD